METSSAISDAFLAAATHGLGLSAKLLLLPRHTLSLSAAPPAAVRSDPFRPAANPRVFALRTRRRTRRRPLTEGCGGGNGYFGRGGGNGRNHDNRGDGGSRPGWEGTGGLTSLDPALEFIYWVMCWFALSNCTYFAFKKMRRLLATREKVFPLRLLI